MTRYSTEEGAGPSVRRPLRGRARKRTQVAGLVGVFLAVLGGCGDSGASPVVEVASFPGSAASLEDLGERVLAGLSAGDRAALTEVRLSEHEHSDVVWPELPASDPALNVPLDYAWNDIQLRDRAALDRIGDWYLEREVRLRDAECEGTQEFETFRVLTDCWVFFDDEGVEPHAAYRAQLFKDVVERGGGYKIFRYYDALPDPVEG